MCLALHPTLAKTQFSLKNKLGIMGNVVRFQVSLIKTTIWAALHRLFPGAFFLPPRSKRRPLIALSGDVSEAQQRGSTRPEDAAAHDALNTHVEIRRARRRVRSR